MVLFDKGDKILKSVDFHKSSTQWIYQLQHAEDVPDRADAAKALGDEKGNDAAVAVLGRAAVQDKFWGVRVEALNSLGKIGGGEAEKSALAAVDNPEPWVREAAVTQLGHFHDETTLVPRLDAVFQKDPAYRVRSAALGALGQMKAPSAFATLESAAKMDSPDDVIRRAALRAMGELGDDRAVPALVDSSQQGKPVRARAVAIASLAKLDKKNEQIEMQLIGFLNDPSFDIKFSALLALGDRGDPAAIEPLEALLKSGTASGTGPMIQEQIAKLRKTGEHADENAAKATQAGAQGERPPDPPRPDRPAGESAVGANTQVVERLDRLERELAEVNDRLKRIEQEMPGKISQ